MNSLRLKAEASGPLPTRVGMNVHATLPTVMQPFSWFPLPRPANAEGSAPTDAGSWFVPRWAATGVPPARASSIPRSRMLIDAVVSACPRYPQSVQTNIERVTRDAGLTRPQSGQVIEVYGAGTSVV